ncbi:ATP-dependent helicase [Terriglobus sp.]|uniref:ATP-dependent helicase n=1 Tax=Terriglobus sp. TaxID=1889013 RepID=UPI003B002CBA
MSIALNTLNENQRRAVEWTEGPLLVLAGPGSGKTSVLAYRIAHLLEASPEKRFRVLGLTFTNKAAIEMRERVYGILPGGSERALLTTFHAFAADVLRQHGSHLGISPDFSILNSDEDRADVFKDALRSAAEKGELVDETDVRLLPLLTNLIEKRVDQNAFATRIRDEQLAERLKLLYAIYWRGLNEHNALDFPLLISLSCDLLKRFPMIARHYRVVYPYVCVDEFQDTNVSQFEFLSALIGKEPSGLFVVADDDQIVYQWNGASPERLDELRTMFNMTSLELPQNYRCPAAIIDIANKLIAHNSNRSKGSLPSGVAQENPHPQPVRVKSFVSPDEEATWVAREAAKLPPKDREFCAVLARTKNLVERVANALTSQGVPVTLSVKKNEFLSSPFKWLHAMLRLANSRGDKEQLRRICSAFYDLEGIKIVPRDVVAASSDLGNDLFRAFVREVLARQSSLDPQCSGLFGAPATELADRMSYKAFEVSALEWFAFLSLGELALPDDSSESFTDYAEELDVWKDLCNTVARRHGVEDPSLNLLLQELDLMPKQAPAPPNAVRCYTIHTAKGMEFENVFVVGMADDILPSYQSLKNGPQSREVQEERRNCFVAITRTKRCLTLTRSQNYFGYDKQPSRFLREMGLSAG